MTPDHEPTVYVIAGPNGAGKTTFATKFLPEIVQCREFVNADLIAAGLSPFAPETQAMRAGRLLLTRIKELSAARRDFGFETTLAGRSYVKMLSDLKTARYRLVLFFLWLPDVNLAVARVANRVLQGGHGIPEGTIRRRFDAGLRNLFDYYHRLMDDFWLYDASKYPPGLIVREYLGERDVHQPELDEFITRTWGDPSHE
jgi:predicted ABC-type ATPase